MKKPVLVVMAAGMGSRYGGLKQIDPIDKEGHRPSKNSPDWQQTRASAAFFPGKRE